MAAAILIWWCGSTKKHSDSNCVCRCMRLAEDMLESAKCLHLHCCIQGRGENEEEGRRAAVLYSAIAMVYYSTPIAGPKQKEPSPLPNIAAVATRHRVRPANQRLQVASAIPPSPLCNSGSIIMTPTSSTVLKHSPLCSLQNQHRARRIATLPRHAPGGVRENKNASKMQPFILAVVGTLMVATLWAISQ